METLKKWYEQVSRLEKLKLDEAKELYIKAINTDNMELKKCYMDKLVLGTLYVINEYVERNNLKMFSASSYDINDIVSSFNQVWIEKIYDGELLNVDSYSYMFRLDFFNDVYRNLCGDEIRVNEQFGIHSECFINLLCRYIECKNEGVDFNYNDIIEKYYGENSNKNFKEIHVAKLIPIFDSAYKNFNVNPNEDFKFAKYKVYVYERFIINMGLYDKLSNCLVDENNYEEKVLNDILMDDFFENMEYVLDERAIKIINQRFGLEDGVCKTLHAISDEFGICREAIRQKEGRTLKKLRDTSPSAKLISFN